MARKTKTKPVPIADITKVGQLEKNPANPRSITPEKLETLRQSLALYGDLGGIVFNRRTGKLVGGHQRVSTFQNDPTALVAITERFEKPDPVGTIAVGHVTFCGTRFSYREVDWSPAKEKGAMLAANQFSGEFVWEDVSRLLAEIKESGEIDLSMTGFDVGELSNLLNADWQKPAVENLEHAATGLVRLILTKEEADIFYKLRSRLNERPDRKDKPFTDGEALVFICAATERCL